MRSKHLNNTLINTGQLDVLTDNTQSQLLLIKAENERLVTGDPVMAVYADEHALHIKEHATVLADPELRFDIELVNRVSAHMQEHVVLLQTTDPNLLGLLGQQPLGPTGGTPNAPQQQQPMPQGAAQNPDVMGGMPVATQIDQMGAAPTGLPNMPQVDPALLPNPELQASQQASLQALQTGTLPQQ